MRTLLVTICMAMICQFSVAQTDIVGQWKTIDDETGKTRSVVEIYQRKGKFYGKVVKLYRSKGEDQDPVCTECDKDDPRYNKKIIGMEIIKNLEKENDKYTDGNILDPANGKVYRCKIWRENNTLYVRGYLGFFYRTQEWEKL